MKYYLSFLEKEDYFMSEDIKELIKVIDERMKDEDFEGDWVITGNPQEDESLYKEI